MTFNKEYLLFISKTPPNDRFMPQTIEDPRQGPVRTYRDIFESANFSLRIQKNSRLSFSTTVSPTLISSFNFFMALNSPVRHEEALECRAAVWYILSVSSNYFNNTELGSAAHVIRLDIISPRCKEVIKQMS